MKNICYLLIFTLLQGCYIKYRNNDGDSVKKIEETLSGKWNIKSMDISGISGTANNSNLGELVILRNMTMERENNHNIFQFIYPACPVLNLPSTKPSSYPASVLTVKMGYSMGDLVSYGFPVPCAPVVQTVGNIISNAYFESIKENTLKVTWYDDKITGVMIIERK